MPIKVTGAKFEKKLKNANELIDAFGASGFILEDAAAFVRDEMINNELNFNPIGRVTSNLARSYAADVVPVNGEVIITSNLTKAPYAPEVANYSRAVKGGFYTVLAVNRVRPIVDESVIMEVKEAARVINSGGTYKYRNPFPPTEMHL